MGKAEKGRRPRRVPGEEEQLAFVSYSSCGQLAKSLVAIVSCLWD
jgi:hypothetical protein